MTINCQVLRAFVALILNKSAFITQPTKRHSVLEHLYLLSNVSIRKKTVHVLVWDFVQKVCWFQE